MKLLKQQAGKFINLPFYYILIPMFVVLIATTGIVIAGIAFKKPEPVEVLPTYAPQYRAGILCAPTNPKVTRENGRIVISASANCTLVINPVEYITRR